MRYSIERLGTIKKGNKSSGISIHKVVPKYKECVFCTRCSVSGYKAKHSTSHALYVLARVAILHRLFQETRFECLCSLLGVFDKVDHHGIFIKLTRRKVPLCFLNVVIYWYSNLTSLVKWNDTHSRSFNVTSGVRQGGILSPKLFIVYVDDLLVTLRKSGVGCHIVELFVAAIMYADDLALLAPTRGALQQLLDVCHDYSLEWCISYNPAKTNVMVFGNSVEYGPLYLNGAPISSVSECKYLGIYVTAGRVFDLGE